MFRLPLYTVQIASAEAQPRMGAVQQDSGFLPNLVPLLANTVGRAQ